MTRLETQFFYVIIFIITIFFGFKSQKVEIKDPKREVKFRSLFFLIAFLIPWFVMCFTNIGADYKNYYEIIDGITIKNYNTSFDQEKLMNLIFLFIKTVFNGNIHISIFFIKTINIGLIYLSFYILRDKIKIGYAIMGYLFLLYLPSFYLLQIALTVAIVNLSILLWVYKDKKILPLIMIIFAGLLHNSAFIFLPIYMVSLLIKNEKKDVKKFFLTIGYIIAMIFAVPIYDFFRTSVQGFHYVNYGSNMYSGTGLMIIVMYLPLILFIKSIKNNYKNMMIRNMIYIYSISSLLMNILSYKFLVIERMEFYMISLYSLFIPTYLMETQKNKKYKITYINLFIIIYYIFRGWLVFYSRTTSSAGVGLYQFFNPFV